MIEPPRLYTEARRQHDLLDVQLLAAFSAEMGLGLGDEMQSVFDQLTASIGTKNFVIQYMIIYDFICGKFEEFEATRVHGSTAVDPEAVSFLSNKLAGEPEFGIAPRLLNPINAIKKARETAVSARRSNASYGTAPLSHSNSFGTIHRRPLPQTLVRRLSGSTTSSMPADLGYQQQSTLHLRASFGTLKSPLVGRYGSGMRGSWHAHYMRRSSLDLGTSIQAPRVTGSGGRSTSFSHSNSRSASFATLSPDQSHFSSIIHENVVSDLETKAGAADPAADAKLPRLDNAVDETKSIQNDTRLHSTLVGKTTTHKLPVHWSTRTHIPVSQSHHTSPNSSLDEDCVDEPKKSEADTTTDLFDKWISSS